MQSQITSHFTTHTYVTVGLIKMTTVLMKCDSQKEGMAYLKDVIHIIIYYR